MSDEEYSASDEEVEEEEVTDLSNRYALFCLGYFICVSAVQHGMGYIFVHRSAME